MLFVLFSALLVGANAGLLFSTKGGAIPVASTYHSVPVAPVVFAEAKDEQIPLESYGPPKPYSFEYSADGHDGRSSRQEASDGKQVTGQYTLQGPSGVNRIVNYVADENGFRASVLTNEPGTESKSPSGIHFKSSQPPAEEIALKYGPREPLKQKFIEQSYEPQPTKFFSKVETEIVKPALTSSYRTDTVHISKQHNADFLKPAFHVAKVEAPQFIKPELTSNYRTDTVHISKQHNADFLKPSLALHVAKVEAPAFIKPELTSSYRTDTVHISKQHNAEFLKPSLAFHVAKVEAPVFIKPELTSNYRTDTVHISKQHNADFLKPIYATEYRQESVFVPKPEIVKPDLTSSYRTDTVHVSKFTPVAPVQKFFVEKTVLPKYETKAPLMPAPLNIPQFPTLMKSKTSPALIYREKLAPVMPIMYEEQQKQETIDESPKMFSQKKEDAEPIEDQKREAF